MSLRNSETRYFLLLLVIFITALYANTFSSGYVWDDRAAIVGNPDVHQNTPLMELFSHDFWGQDITDVASHKSYRPLTVLSYRLNFYFTALSPVGFHVGNVLIYILTVCVFYLAAIRWISVEGSRVASLLFAAHPVHCEAVSSLVGRADCLSGLFFLAAMIFYSDGLGRLRVCSGSVNTHGQANKSTNTFAISNFININTGVVWSNFLLAFLFGLAASLSKEIGLTIFGIFVVFEAIYVSSLSLSLKLSTHFLRDYIAVILAEGEKGTEKEGETGTEEVKRRQMREEEHTRWVYWINRRETSQSQEQAQLPCQPLMYSLMSSFSSSLSCLWTSWMRWPPMTRVFCSWLTYLQHVWGPHHHSLGSSSSSGNSSSGSTTNTTTNNKATTNKATPHQANTPRCKSPRECLQWFSRFPPGTYARIAFHVLTLLCILLFRSRLHGDTQLYTWTVMENPISLQEKWLTRVLSYSHTHYLMLLKLLNPITPHLCFDYGHYCLPIITSVFQAVNLLACVAYALVLYLLVDTVLLGRRAGLLALALFLLPLLPALNILFPVGTTLAERLLFVPSMGLALLVGEFIANTDTQSDSNSCSYSCSFQQRIWAPIGKHWARYCLNYVVLCILYSTILYFTI